MPERAEENSDYAVLYIRAGDNLDAIDSANEWAQGHDFERARELTLGQAIVDGELFYIARCYRLLPGER